MRSKAAVQPESFHSASIAASTGWIGTQRFAPVFVVTEPLLFAMMSRPRGIEPGRDVPPAECRRFTMAKCAETEQGVEDASVPGNLRIGDQLLQFFAGEDGRGSPLVFVVADLP